MRTMVRPPGARSTAGPAADNALIEKSWILQDGPWHAVPGVRGRCRQGPASSDHLLPHAPVRTRSLRKRAPSRLVIVAGVQQFHALKQRHGGKGAVVRSSAHCGLPATNRGRHLRNAGQVASDQECAGRQ